MQLHASDDDEAVTSLYFGDAPTSLGDPEQPMLALSAAIGGHTRVAYLAELGRLAAQAGRYDDAWSYLQRVLQLQQAEPHPPAVVARTLCELAVVAIRRDDLSTGRILLTDAAALTPDIHPSVLHNLGYLARRDGALDTAESLYTDALTLKISAGGWRQATVAATLGAIGQLQLLRDQPLAALRSLLPARHIYELCSSAVSSGMAFTLMAMGRAYLKLHMYEHASAALDRAVAIREAIPVPPDQLACARYHLALALWPIQPDAAITLVRATLGEYRQSPGARPTYVHTLQSWLEARCN